jgi:hypothetical protein
MVRILNVLVVGILLAAVSGCETMPWKKDTMPPVELLDETKAASGGEDTMTGPAEKPAALQMSTSQRIKDIPLPAKAKEDLDRTYVYESSTLQLGRMVYTIRASVNEVAQFYIDNMTAAGWERIDLNQAEGGTKILYRKPGKKLDVSVIPLGAMRGQRLILHLVPDQATGM